MSGLILSWPATTSEVGLGFIKRIIQFVGKEQYGSDHIIRIHHGNKIDSVTKKWTQGRTKYRITTLVPVKASHYYTRACEDFTSQTPAPAIPVMELTIPVHKELMRCVLSRMWYWICDIDVVTRTVWNLFLCVHIVFMSLFPILTAPGDSGHFIEVSLIWALSDPVPLLVCIVFSLWSTLNMKPRHSSLSLIALICSHRPQHNIFVWVLQSWSLWAELLFLLSMFYVPLYMVT